MRKPSGKSGRRAGGAAALLIALSVLAACGAGGGDGKGGAVSPDAEAGTPVAATKWTVSALLDRGKAGPLPEATAGRAYLTFDADGKVQGRAGCNLFHGSARISTSAHTIAFGPLGTTRMMCTDPEMRLEREVLGILRGTVGYRVDHRTLTLTAASGAKGLSATAG
ncbi:META domain-containing protein [Streptomyces sp. NPDC006530]|uniref:META domain-containing protein n=1 Tax=Streptomyces sp. NPDC006530 TaxID=3364750 RepID=UPI0036AA7323